MEYNPMYLFIVYGYFHTTTAELRSCNKGHLWLVKPKFFFHPTIFRKKMLMLCLGDF